MRGVTCVRIYLLDKLEFKLTRLMRGVTLFIITMSIIFKFQLTRLMRGVTAVFDVILSDMKISTHTPHARRDRSSN